MSSASKPKNQLQEFLSNLSEKDRELVVASLDLQLETRKPLSSDEKRDRLAAQILKQLG